MEDNAEKNKISEENAEKQIALLTGDNIIYDSLEDSDLKEALENSLNVLKSAIMRGFVEIKLDKNQDIETIQYLQRPRGDVKEIKYKECDAEAKLYMGKHSNDNSYEKSYQLLGYLSGLGIDGIKKLRRPDDSIAECLSAVFLGI
jgi:hypothetical protein